MNSKSLVEVFLRSRFSPPMLLAISVCLLAPNSLCAQTLGDAVDAPQLTWTTGGNQPWVGQTTVRHDGVDAARSGAIGDSQESWLQTTVTGPGTLVFWWKVSSEAAFEYLEFQVNGSTQSGPISGEVDWRQELVELGAGSQTLRWLYSKDPVAASGQDCGWVDTVGFFPPTGPPKIIANPLSRTAEEGTSVTIEVAARGASPLSYQWYQGQTPVAGAQSPMLTRQNLSFADAGQYTVRVLNSLGSVTSAPPAVLTVLPASLDAAFNPGTDGEVRALAVQADGKILAGGSFSTLGGQPRENLGRLNADGTLDTTFAPDATGAVNSFQVQADGKILVGGSFDSLGGQPRDNLGRLNPDGTVDGTFNPGAGANSFSQVSTLAVQPDGKILVGGSFNQIAGQSRTNLARLNANGTLDPTFVRDIEDSVSCLALQANGSILVGGQFTILNLEGVDLIAYFNLVRLATNGTVDVNFYPDPDGSVTCIAVQPDGKILLSGGFTILDSGNSAFYCAGLGRVDGNGNPDSSFNPNPDGQVSSMVLQTDGKILVGGDFSNLGGQPRSRIARLNANGTIDSTLNPTVAGFSVSGLAIQGDGKVLTGGSFTTVGSQSRSNLARLNATTTPTQSLNYVAGRPAKRPRTR